MAGGRLTPALAARHISKSFGVQRALDDVSLAVEAGEVHGLVGERLRRVDSDPDSGRLPRSGQRRPPRGGRQTGRASAPTGPVPRPGHELRPPGPGSDSLAQRGREPAAVRALHRVAAAPELAPGAQAGTRRPGPARHRPGPEDAGAGTASNRAGPAGRRAGGRGPSGSRRRAAAARRSPPRSCPRRKGSASSS